MPYPAQIDPSTIGERALEIVEAQGWDGWSLRQVAESLGVSANALYRHVGNREGLHVEIAAAAARALAQAVGRRGLPREGAPRVVAIARRYVHFGVRRPDAYRAFMEAKPALDHPRIGPWLELWSTIRDEVGRVVPSSADAAGFALWAFLHGRIQLALGPARAARADAGLDDAVRALLAGFESTGPVPSPLPPRVARSGANTLSD